MTEHEHVDSRGAENAHSCSRRSFLGGSLSCGAHVLLGLAAAGSVTRRAFAQETAIAPPVAEAPFARIDKIADGVWAVTSTPMDGDFTTLSNGGIIAGSEGTLVIEGFNTPEGAGWVNEQAKALTGRYPTHVVLTHFHADHSAGLGGFLGAGRDVTIISTSGTRDLLLERQTALTEPSPDDASGLSKGVRQLVIPDGVITDTRTPTKIDLGGRVVRITDRQGHTPSDATVEVEDPHVLWTGDLVFNGLFPFYGDAIPSQLTRHCNAILKDPSVTYVPGHGAVTDSDGLKTYLGLLDSVEAAARAAFEKGTPAVEAWKEYKIPESLGAWVLFRPDIVSFAFLAWEKELKSA